MGEFIYYFLVMIGAVVSIALIIGIVGFTFKWLYQHWGVEAVSVLFLILWAAFLSFLIVTEKP